MVEIRPYDPAWPRLFAALEHIGSTAVPGLAAKPVVDMMAAVADRARAERGLPAVNVWE